MSKLFLIPTTLANSISGNALLSSQITNIKHLQFFIVETAKTARMHLKHLQLDHCLQSLHLQELNKHQQNIQELMLPLLAGHDVGLLSDCGQPAIADPGGQVVRLAHQHNIEVVPLVGPSSLMLALMASGVNGQTFAFNGYLPINTTERLIKIKQLQQLINDFSQSQIIIEAPFRNQQLLSSLIDNLTVETWLCIAIELMSDGEQIISKPVSQWRKIQTLPNIHKKEVVFVLGK